MIGMGAIEIAIGDTGSTLMRRVLAIDLGGTNIRSAAGTGDMVNLRHLRREAAPASLDAFVACVFGLIAQAGDIDAIGLAIPGLVDGTLCRWVPNLPYLDGVDLAPLFPGLSLSVGNDAHFALLAEAKRGAGKSLSDVLLLAIGTGIGSAVLVNGSIAKGAHGAACSFGWTCADVEDAGAERDGWLERVASGRAINAIALKAGFISGAALIDAARAGDPRATELVALPARRLGTALAGAVALLAPQAILVSGGIADALDVLAPEITAAAQRHLPQHLKALDLKPGVFGSQAGLVGAALAAEAGQGWRHLT
jgi:predicted NBD/HSP70 family sugar kinase